MNLAEHPQALGLMKRINASEADPKFTPAQIFMPYLGAMMGTVRLGSVPGLFTMTSNVEITGADIGNKGIMDFDFTADQPIMITYPDLTQDNEKSKIIS